MMNKKTQSVRIVFCGGCNAGYDRGAAAKDIRRRLEADGAFTVIDDGQPDVVVAVCGCTCACVDEAAVGNARIVPVTDEQAARDILTVLKRAGAPSVMPGSDPDLDRRQETYMTFQQTRRIDYFQTATDGRIKLDALMRILQNAALDHVHEADRDTRVIIAAGYAWILNKVILDLARYPLYGETVTVNTWHRGTRGFKSYREYEILAGNQRVATAASSWLFLDLARRKVVKVPRETDGLYGVVPAMALDRDIEAWKPDKNLVPEECMEIITRRSDYDMLGHVNNAVYFDYLDTLLGNQLGDSFGVRTVAIQYNREIGRHVKRIRAGLARRENGACAYTFFDASGVYACGDIVLA